MRIKIRILSLILFTFKQTKKVFFFLGVDKRFSQVSMFLLFSKFDRLKSLSKDRHWPFNLDSLLWKPTNFKCFTVYPFRLPFYQLIIFWWINQFCCYQFTVQLFTHLDTIMVNLFAFLTLFSCFFFLHLLTSWTPSPLTSLYN